MNSRTMAAAAVVAAVVIVAAAAVVLMSGDEEESYTEFIVAFDANGGTGSMSELSCEPGSTIEVPECAFDNKGNFRLFVSWNTEADGTGTEYLPSSTIGSDEVGKQTLYAQWKVIARSDLTVGSYYVIQYVATVTVTSGDYSMQIERTLTDTWTVTAVSDTEFTFQVVEEETYKRTESGETSTSTSTYTSTQTEDRYMDYSEYDWTTAEASTVWGTTRDAMCITVSGDDEITYAYVDTETLFPISISATEGDYSWGGATYSDSSLEANLLDWYYQA